MTEGQQISAVARLLRAQGYEFKEAQRMAEELLGLNKPKREYTLLYLDMDNVWSRVTAVYDSFDGAMFHAREMLTTGLCIRLLTRAKAGEHWCIAKGVPPNDIRDGIKLWNVAI